MNESEWQTRKQRIDARLRSLHPPWQIIRDPEGIDRSALSCHAVGRVENIGAKVPAAVRDIG